jgi:hypothetical protein
LENHIESSLLDDGYYGYFTVHGASSFSLHPSLHRTDAAPYVFNYHGELSSLSDLMEQIRMDLPPGTEVTLHTWNGFSF